MSGNVQSIAEGGLFLNTTATTTINGLGNLLGFMCNTASGGTVALVAGNGTISPAVSVSAGQYYPYPGFFTGNLTVTIAGTANITLFWVV